MVLWKSKPRRKPILCTMLNHRYNLKTRLKRKSVKLLLALKLRNCLYSFDNEQGGEGGRSAMGHVCVLPWNVPLGSCDPWGHATP